MKQFLAAAFLIYGLIPQFFLSLWLALHDHYIAGCFALFTLVLGIAFVICDISEDEKRHNEEKQANSSLTQRSVVSL